MELWANVYKRYVVTLHMIFRYSFLIAGTLGSGIPSFVLGPRGQHYRISLTSPVRRYRTTQDDTLTWCDTMVRSAQIRSNHIRLLDQIKSDTIRSEHIESNSIEFDCCCIYLFIHWKCKILLLKELIVMLHCIEHHLMLRAVNCMYYMHLLLYAPPPNCWSCLVLRLISCCNGISTRGKTM